MTRILVIGDIMLDRYVIGTVERISPEAPVPVVLKNDSYSVLGGCGNVIRNLAELDCEIYCKTIVGQDRFGAKVKHKLEMIQSFHDDFVETSVAYQTTTKHRIIADHRLTQMIRIDEEEMSPMITFTEKEMQRIEELNFDIIIISDYHKGVITDDLMKQVKKLGIRFIVDPKPCNMYLYRDAYAITPNEREFKQMYVNDLELQLNAKFYVKTMGDKGIAILDKEFNEVAHIKANPVEVFNVSGAGDTVISIVAYCIAKGNDIQTSCHIANECAHYVVTKPDTSVVPSTLFKTIYLECGGV